MKDTVLVGAVFDCNVYLQAAVREKSVAAEYLRLVEKGLIRLYLSEEITAEVEEVLKRPEIRNHFQTLTDEIIEAFILRLRNNSQIIRQIQREFSYSRDPDDEPYINLAITSKADFLVSRDNDLLDLMTSV
jgi:putative PIN family toxin of toxin-antitoxin system